MGYRVSIAGNEKAAVETLNAGGVDVVISDMKLGDGQRPERAARPRGRVPAPPEVILITAFGTPAAAVEAMRAGAYDYICKPFDNEELKLLVQKALEKRGLREENRQLRRSLSGMRRAVGGQTARRCRRSGGWWRRWLPAAPRC